MYRIIFLKADIKKKIGYTKIVKNHPRTLGIIFLFDKFHFIFIEVSLKQIFNTISHRFNLSYILHISPSSPQKVYKNSFSTNKRHCLSVFKHIKFRVRGGGSGKYDSTFKFYTTNSLCCALLRRRCWFS